MSFEAKIKITAESGASINYVGPIDEAQKDAIVGILNGETDIATLEQEARQMRARMERLECENDALRKDAERYRLLRRGQHWSVINGIGDTIRAGDLDASIDAAKKGGTSC